jgi:DNA-binding protein YbaB
MADQDQALDDMIAQAQQAVHARRAKLDQRLITARDDWELVEVGVNGHGDVVEVAVNTALARRASPSQLAEAVLQAARAAQDQAKSERKG